MTRNLRYALGAALVVALAAGYWFTLQSSADNNLAYETKQVDRGAIERVVSASGDVNPLVTVQVGTQVSGQISVVDVDFNSEVKKGQRLALIDPQSLQSRLTQSKSDLTGARTQVALQAANFEHIMLVSVTERTREIGLRLAVGARKSDILLQFLIETTALCLIGGAIGVLAGVGGALTIASVGDWPIQLRADTIGLGILASLVVGLVFGLLPPRRAASLNPIDALRSE